MVATFAHRHWHDFERLSFELTTDCFGVKPTKLFRTTDQKDGGYDAVFFHEIGKLGNAVVAYETLMEAKLRTSPDNVGLRAFAATMIIAFNGQTQCLVVVTNREFTPQALEAARDFQWKSRVQVILASRRTVSAWIRPRLESLRARYPRELLDTLLHPDPIDEEYSEVAIARSECGLEPAARIAFGSLGGGRVADGTLTFVAPSDPASDHEAVIGGARQALVERVAKVLDGAGGCLVIEGAAGVGKSHIVRAALHAMGSERRCVGRLDLTEFVTSRRLFLELLAHISGIEVAEAARQFSSTGIRGLFSTAGGKPVSSDVQDALVRVFGPPDISREERAAVDHALLAEYLRAAAASREQIPKLIVLDNVEHAPAEALEFLHTIVPLLTPRNVTIIVELTSADAVPAVGRSQWASHLAVFRRVADLGCFAVPRFEREDGIEFLQKLLPGLGRERCASICDRVGNQPLYLRHAALWLKQHHIVSARAPTVHLIESPEIFFEGLRPETCAALLDRHVDIWRREVEFPYADAITTATLLSGRVPRVAAALLTPPGTRTEQFLDALIATGLFVPEPRLEGVRVSHSLLLERMIAIDEGRVPGLGGRWFERRRVAVVLLAAVPSLDSSPAMQQIHRSALLVAAERWEEARDAAYDAGRRLAHEHQLALASVAFERAVVSADRLIGDGAAEGASLRTQSLVALLEVENSRYRLGISANAARLRELADWLTTSRYSADPAGRALVLRGQYVHWRSAFTQERFVEALRISRAAFADVVGTVGADDELAGRAVSALGITLKAIERTHESTEIFDAGVRVFPHSAYCRMERWSNLAALALRNSPRESLQHYQRILSELGGAIPLLEQTHVEVDVAMALFLLDDLDAAAAQAVRAMHTADANGIPAESSRGRNILGCVQWCASNLEAALATIDRAILDAERSYMERFLWRYRVNLASVACEAGNAGVALASARWAEERLTRTRAARWNDVAATPTHLTSRWYAALLAIGSVYDRCHAARDLSRLRRLVTLPEFSAHLDELLRGVFPSAVFGNTTHLHGTRIMITG